MNSGPVGSGRFRKVLAMEQVSDLFRDGMSLMFGGFGSIGTPPLLVEALLQSGVRDLTLIGNDSGYPSYGVGRLIAEQRVSKLVASHIGSNPTAIEQMNAGTLEVEFVPQGTLAERIRAGGAGLGGILTDVGAGTEIDADGPHAEVDGRRYRIEPAIRAPLAIVLAEYGDEYGNLVYPASARNFNPLVATAADVVIAEVRNLVACGEVAADLVHTPGVFVDYVVGGSTKPERVPVPKT
ncbi:MAG: CoA transferase subunit A [Trueperaceae bacterium]